MRAISGAVLILAATVLFGASVVADALMAAHRTGTNAPNSGIALFFSMPLGLLGLVIFGIGLFEGIWSQSQRSSN